ncbi:MAG: alpha/beta fold hydrolase [Pseudobdellovibrionaceae bacterium]
MNLSFQKACSLFVHFLFIFFAGLSFARPGQSELASDLQPQKGFIKLSDKVERYVEYSQQKNDKPLVVMVNGLVYDVDRWADLRQRLQLAGYSTLNYYFRGQLLTLKKEKQTFGQPLFFKSGLEGKDFAEELHGLLGQLKVDKPVVVLGLSYGASIAAEFAQRYPAQIEQLIIMSPLVKSLDKYTSEGQWLSWNLDAIAMWWGPFWGPAVYDAAYKLIYQSYLSSRVVPERVPSMFADDAETYKQSLFYLIRATRKFDLTEYDFSALKDNKVHYLLAKEDDNRVFQDQVTAFKRVAPVSQGALIWLSESEHAIPDSQPAQAASYISYLLNKDSRIKYGQTYKADSEGLKLWQPK